MPRPVLALLAVLLVWLAHTYAAITPIADLGIAHVPATTGAAVVLPLVALAYVLRRAARDTPRARGPIDRPASGSEVPA